MTSFKNLFCIEPVAIQKTCVVVPYLVSGLLKALGIEELKKGKLYATANTDTFTFIKAGLGTLLVGDAILYLDRQTARRSCILAPAVWFRRQTS